MQMAIILKLLRMMVVLQDFLQEEVKLLSFLCVHSFLFAESAVYSSSNQESDVSGDDRKAAPRFNIGSSLSQMSFRSGIVD